MVKDMVIGYEVIGYDTVICYDGVVFILLGVVIWGFI